MEKNCLCESLKGFDIHVIDIDGSGHKQLTSDNQDNEDQHGL